MPPKKSCSCKIHDTTCDSAKVHNLESSKKYSKTIIALLVEEGNLSARAKLLCSSCYDNACERFKVHEEQSENAKRQKPDKYTLDEIIDLIKNKGLSEDVMSNIMKATGAYLHDKLYRNVERNYAEREGLENMSYIKEMSAYSTVLCEFLQALAGSSQIGGKILNAAEVLTHLVNPDFIGKLNFSMNLISYFITGSRTVVELKSKYSPSGSYTTLMKYLDKHSKESNTPPNDKDIVIYFDNNQVLARSWNVKYNNKALVSVVTTLISLCPPNSAQLERNPNLSPLQWLREVNTGDVCDLYKEEQLDSKFRVYRNQFIMELLDELLKEQQEHNGTVEDNIDNEIEKTRMVTFDDDFNISYEKNETDPYSSIQSNCEGKTDVTVLDPIDINPCSYDSVSKVMSHIDENSDRAWNIIGCDGLPYLLCSRLIERSHTCPRCSLQFKSKPEFETHLNINHRNSDINVNTCRSFGNFLLIPGLGHYEINYTKAMFLLLWTVILVDLAKLLGFRSIKALVACEAATNHHKSWQILQIFLKGASRELLLPYVKQCIRSGTEPELNGVYEWLGKCKSKNLKFLFTCVFTYCFALDLFRKGVRRSNYDVILVAMNKLSPLFYGLNKTQYMEIDLRHKITMKQCPDSVKQFICQVLSLSQSGHPSKCEGGDFILESKNKRMKMWLPSGAPTMERWLRVCRNLDSMDRLKSSVCEGLSEDSSEAGFRFVCSYMCSFK